MIYLSKVYDRSSVDPKQNIPFWDRKNFLWILESKSDAQMLKQERFFLRLVKGMSAVAKDHKAEFMVLMIPVNFQVEPQFLPKVLGSNKFRVKRNYFDELKPQLDSMDIDYLDLLEEMKSIPGQYYPRNGEVHFNPKGHLFTAQRLKLFLGRKGFCAG